LGGAMICETDEQTHYIEKLQNEEKVS